MDRGFLERQATQGNIQTHTGCRAQQQHPVGQGELHTIRDP